MRSNGPRLLVDGFIDYLHWLAAHSRKRSAQHFMPPYDFVDGLLECARVEPAGKPDR